MFTQAHRVYFFLLVIIMLGFVGSGCGTTMVDGGSTGFSGVSIVSTGGGFVHMVGVRGTELHLFTYQNGNIHSKEVIASYAAAPSIATSPDGILHIVYIDPARQAMVHASKSNGRWVDEVIQSLSAYSSENYYHYKIDFLHIYKYLLSKALVQ